MKRIEIDGYRRISKPAARKAYQSGETVYIIPCKLSPANVYMPAMAISCKPSQDETPVNMPGCAATFEKRVNAFEYYNCSPETGNYTAFYTRS